MEGDDVARCGEERGGMSECVRCVCEVKGRGGRLVILRQKEQPDCVLDRLR